MASTAQLRQQIEATLATRAGAPRLALAPRLVAPGHETGYLTLDQVLRGGLPVAGTTEILGSRSSGRTSIAMAALAERTREGLICAWVDVAGDLSPEAALADGVDFDRVLWIRCAATAVAERPTPTTTITAPPPPPALQLVGSAFPAAKPDLRPYNPTRKRQVGTPGAPNRPLAAEKREVQVATDRLPARRGNLVLHSVPNVVTHNSAGEAKTIAGVRSAPSFTPAKKPWSRLEQAIKAVDLLIQAGGFGLIVLDLGCIAPQFARRIPLATWFRWRSALERTRSALIVLTLAPCAGSAAELVLRVQATLPEAGTVLAHIPYRLEVVRRRFEEPSAATGRKPPQSTAAWHTRAAWAAS